MQRPCRGKQACWFGKQPAGWCRASKADVGDGTGRTHPMGHGEHFALTLSEVETAGGCWEHGWGLTYTFFYFSFLNKTMHLYGLKIK